MTNNLKFSFFHWIFDKFVEIGIMANIRNALRNELRNADNWAMNTLWKPTQIYPWDMLFRREKFWKFGKNSKIFVFHWNSRIFWDTDYVRNREKKLMHCYLDQTYIRIIGKYKRFNNIYGQKITQESILHLN